MKPDHKKAINHLENDLTLHKILKIPDFEYRLSDDGVYKGLIKSICSQQLSTTAAATIYNRFDILLNQDHSPENILSKEHEVLRSVGLSNAKSKYIKEVASYFSDENNRHKKWEKISDEEIIAELTTIKGVGVWTVQMILIFQLDRSDVLPLGDLIVLNGIKELYGLKSEKKQLLIDCEAVAESWRPYRSMASRYLWHGKDLIFS
jgi:DNA-3-methyladenine glycosylase II